MKVSLHAIEIGVLVPLTQYNPRDANVIHDEELCVLRAQNQGYCAGQ